MSLAAIRPFLRARLESLGYKEHSDAFDDANRPQNNLDMLFRIENGPVNGAPANHSTHTFENEVTIQVTIAGGINNVEAKDRAFQVIEEIYGDLLSESVRIGTAIKNIEPTTSLVSAYSLSDDKDVLISIGLNIKTICQF